MENNKAIAIFESKQIRRYYDSAKDVWYFSLVDIVAALTDSVNATDYLKKLRKRDNELNSYLGTNCPQVAMESTSGVTRKTLGGSAQHIFRLIQSIPSPKAEPFKQWLAKVGYERMQEIQDPEMGLDRALENYMNLGYSENWINQRLKSIEVRKELTDEWKKRGLKEGQQFGVLTDIIPLLNIN